MPQVLAAFKVAYGYIAGLAASGGITGAVTKGLLYLGTAVATSIGAKMLQKKPDFGDFQSEATQRLNSTMGATASRRVVYGKQRVGGAIVYVESHGDDNKFLNLVYALAGHQCEAIDEIWLDDEVLTFAGSDGDATNDNFQHPEGFGPLVFARKHLGAAGQTADGDLTGVSSTWGVNHRLRGITYIYLRLHFDPERMVTIPNLTAIVRGKNDIYDFRSATAGYTDNAALCVADYMMDTSIGLGIDQADIDQDTIVASANTCDEAVALFAGGTEPRYALNGTFQLSTAPKSVLETMLTAMAGRIADPGGVWFIHAGGYTTPTITLDEDDLRAGLRIKTRPTRRDTCNAVRGIYSNPQANYQSDDLPPVTNATYLAEDGGERIWRDIELPYTTSAATGQRIEKIELERTRQGIIIEYPANLRGYQVQEGDTVAIDNTRMGWTGKVFEVMGATLVIEGEGDNTTYGCDLALRETAAEVWDWNSGEETTVDPAPNTNLPDPSFVAPPTALTVESGTDQLIRKGDKTIISRAKLAWTRPIGAFAVRIQPEYKLSTGDDGDWVKLPQISAQQTQMWISDVTDGEDYDFRVAAVNGLGVLSAYATVSAHGVIGKTADPGVPTGLALTPGPQSILVEWTPPGDVDLKSTQVMWDTAIDFTDSPLSAVILADDGAASTEYTIDKYRPNPAGQVQPIPGGTTFYVRARSVDTTGNRSAWTSVVNADAGDPTAGPQGPAGADGTDGTDGEDALTGWIEPSGSLVWTRAIDAGAWDPISTTMDLDVYFHKSGADVARIARRVTRDGSGILSVGTTTHKDTDLNTGTVTVTVTGSGTTSANVKFSYSSGADTLSLSATVGTVQGGNNGAQGDTGPAGADGNDGAQGDTGNKVVRVYKEDSTGVPATPTGGGTPTGWSTAKPATGIIWQSESTQTFDNILVGSWTTPVRTDGTSTLFADKDSIATAVLITGDIVFDSTENNRIYRWNGTAWADVQKVLDDGEVLTAKLAANAVTLAKMAANSVDTAQLVASAVEEAKIAGGAITAAKIAAAAVIAGKIATDAVTANTIAANAVTTAKIAADAITANEIAAGAIEAQHVGANEIIANTANIANAIITDAKISDLSVGKLLAGTITGKEIVVAGGTSGILRSDNYVAGTSGWQIDGSGSFEANDGTFRGAINIADAVGNVLIDGNEIRVASVLNPDSDAFIFATDFGSINAHSVRLILKAAQVGTLDETTLVAESFASDSDVRSALRSFSSAGIKDFSLGTAIGLELDGGLGVYLHTGSYAEINRVVSIENTGIQTAALPIQVRDTIGGTVLGEIQFNGAHVVKNSDGTANRSLMYKDVGDSGYLQVYDSANAPKARIWAANSIEAVSLPIRVTATLGGTVLGEINATGGGDFKTLKLSYADIPTSAPGIAGTVWRDANDFLKIDPGE